MAITTICTSSGSASETSLGLANRLAVFVATATPARYAV